MKMLEELGTSPAPWTATADADGGVVVNDENRHGIAACGHTAEGDVDFANARLIAAAPNIDFATEAEAEDFAANWEGAE